jgi:predicted RNA-binding Zn ribbon-like protein
MTELPNRTYRWTFIGGHLALDLCNTMSWRVDPARRIDRLAEPELLLDWFAVATHLAPKRRRGISQAPPEEAEKALRAVRELRDALIRVLDAELDQAPMPAADVDLIATAWRKALAVATTAERLPWSWQVAPAAPADLVHVLALSAAELLHRPDQSGLRRCDGDGCAWFFLDTTRNHSRRWCDPQDCGNRARVRAYSERTRARAGGAT